MFMVEGKSINELKVGDSAHTITARIEIIGLVPKRNRAKFKTTCMNQNGQIAVDGTAWAIPPKGQATF